MFHGAAEQDGNFLGDRVAAGGAAQTFEVALSHTGFGKSTAASLSAATTVGTGEHFGNFVNQRVFHHLEFLGYKIEHHGKEGANNA